MPPLPQQGGPVQISRVLIKNFRSIKTLEFHPEPLCALVGENNAGKSNILAALNLLLGEVWPTKQRIEPSDYYDQDTTQPIQIEVDFEENPENIHRLSLLVPWEDRTETKVVYKGNDKAYYLTSEIRDKCALVYLDANRDLDSQLRTSSWALFGRIIRRLDEDFREVAEEKDKKALIQRFEEARDLLRTDLFKEFENTIKDAFNEQLRRTTHRVELEFRTFDPLNYYRSIQVQVWENEKFRSPAESGQGMRNLILLAMFRTYASVFKGKAVIAIEEPEIFLHPHTQRSLYSLFQDLAAKGAQIFYSTHSPAFLEVPRFSQVLLVRKALHGPVAPVLQTTVTNVKPEQLLGTRQSLHPGVPLTLEGMLERYRNICGPEHNEAFFARKVVIVEGPTEAMALPILACARGVDFDVLGVSIVSAGGKTNIDQLYHLYTSFGLPTYVIFDGDRGSHDPAKARWNRILLRMLGQPELDEPAQSITPTFAVLETDFETSLAASLEAAQPGLYAELNQAATNHLGPAAGKGLVARFVANAIVDRAAGTPSLFPEFIAALITHIASLGETLPSAPEESVVVSF